MRERRGRDTERESEREGEKTKNKVVTYKLNAIVSQK